MNKFLLFICLLLNFQNLNSQSIVIQPDGKAGIDAFIFELEPNTNYGDYSDFITFFWTFGGTPAKGNCLLKFNLEGIKKDMKITKALLSLYHSNSTNQGQAGNNASTLNLLKSSWAESSVTWNNQPIIDETNSIILATSTSSTQNYVNIDLTNFVKNWYSDPASNNGLIMKLLNNDLLSSMKFCSSDNIDPSKRPKLEIFYEVESSECELFQPDASTGKDAFIFSNEPFTNFGSHPDLISFAWTFNGNVGSGKSLIRFDISSLPSNVEIVSARLSLFHNPFSTNQGQAGNNACFLRKVIDDWDESLVTWNSSPSTTTTNQIYLEKSQSATQNYIDIDLLNFCKDWYEDHSKNFGIMLTLEDYTPLSSMKFSSSDNTVPSIRPALEICYNKKTNVKNYSNYNSLKIFPIIFNESVSIISSSSNYNIEVYNINGTLLSDIKIIENAFILDLSNLPKGIYFIKYKDEMNSHTQKIIKAE